MQDKLVKFVFKHPKLLQAAKLILSSRLVANNPVYKYLVMRKAKKYAQENQEFKSQIYIETVLDCNSRCVFCAQSNKRMTGTMSMELFKKIIDECHEYGIKNAILSMYGEFMLDKHLFERIEYLRKYDMVYGFVTNASLLTEERVNKFFDLGGLTYVNFSANGFAKDVYEKMMVGLKRDTAYKNILYFLEQKEKRRADDLVVTVSTVLTKLNKNDFKDFFSFWSKQKGVNSILPTELVDRMGKDYAGELGDLGPMSKKHNWLSPCKSIWNSLVVFYDGRVAPCCVDADNRQLIIGDLTKQTVREVTTGEARRRFQQQHLTGERKNHPVCGKCYVNSVWFGQK